MDNEVVMIGDKRSSYSLADDYDGDYVWDEKLKAFRAPKYPGEKGDKIKFK